MMFIKNYRMPICYMQLEKMQSVEQRITKILCRVVDDNEEWLTISVADYPKVVSGNQECFKDLNEILEYVKMHTDILLRHWFGELVFNTLHE